MSLPNDKCLFCKGIASKHDEGCKAAPVVEIAFPDAPHTTEGQRKAARAHRKRIREVGRATCAAVAERYGEPHVRRIELAVRACVKGLTPDESAELERLNEAGA